MGATPARGDWALRGRYVALPDGIRPAAVLVRGERVAAVVEPDRVPAGCPVEDLGERLLMPGAVDTHVHVNEPGRTDWEGFATATRAAAAGGVTTVVDMPLNSSPVTTTPAALRQKQEAARGQLWVDCGFHGGVVPGNADQVGPLADAGVLGFKAFLCPSGVDEFPAAAEADLRAVMPHLAARGLPLLAHAELISPLAPAVEAAFAAEPWRYAAYLATRPPRWEVDAIRLLIALCREYRCPVHVVHLSAADALPPLAEARAAGLPLTVETCPHYLCFAAEEVPDGDPRFKCAPPVRGAANRERLWDGLRAGLIDTIGSDHSPAPPGLKHLDTGDLRRAWGGIASLQLAPAAVCAEAWRRGGVTLADAVRWLCRRPAELVGLGRRKGALAAGFDADLVVLDFEAEFVVAGEGLWHRHKATPYEGRRLRGRVERTYLRGRKVFEAGRFVGGPGGQVLRRS